MRLGTVTFQTNDSRDIFYVADVYESGAAYSDEAFIGIEDSQFSGEPFVTGATPLFAPVEIEGDNALISAWFKGDVYNNAIVISIYVEYEETEQLVSVESDEAEQGSVRDPLEPIEIHL